MQKRGIIYRFNHSYRMEVGGTIRRRLRHALAQSLQLSASDDAGEALMLLAAQARRIEAAIPREHLLLPSLPA